MEKELTVLILAYDFPPYVSVGALRPYNWYKYFREFGIYPVLITRQWGNDYGNQLDYVSASNFTETVFENTEYGTVIRTPYKPNLANRILLRHGEKKFRFFRKMITAYYEFAQFILPIGPKKELYKAARVYLKNNKPDCIIASGDPFVLFNYAAKLSKEFDIPWIADYRDPWSHNQEQARSFVQKRWNRFFERKTVGTATHVLTVSEFVKSKIRELLPEKEFSILRNGYDPQVVTSVQHIRQQSDELRISFVGTIYDWYPIESFIRVVNDFITENPNRMLQISFIGTNIPDELALLAQRYPNLEGHITIHPKIPNIELLQLLAKDNVMLLFNSFSYIGTKIFDYLAIRRKMILCYYDDPEAEQLKRKHYAISEESSANKQLQADLIRTTNSGIIVRDSHHLKEVLTDLYEEFLTTGQVACNSTGVENYSRKIQVEQLAALLHQVASNCINSQA